MSRVWLLLLAGSLVAPRAWADGAGDKASADALFAEGRRLMAAGSYTAACEKLSASQRLDPAFGTALSLADCFEKSGKTASAWAELRDAAAAAQAAGLADRAQAARGRATALEARISRLTIRSPAVGVQVARDGKAVDLSALGTAVPVDTGTYKIEASAPGKKTWSQSIEVKADGENVVVEIPMLADEPNKPAEPEPRRRAMDSGRAGSGQRGLAVGVAVVGVAGLAIGAYAGLHAASLWNDAKASCRSYPNDCGAAATGQSQDAIAAGNLSTVAFAIGVAGLAGGAALFFTAPRQARSAAVTVGVTPRAVVLGGSF